MMAATLPSPAYPERAPHKGEHPWVLVELPLELLAAFWEDSLIFESVDAAELLDAWHAKRLLLKTVIPAPRTAQTSGPLLCPSCGTPISPTGECRCSGNVN